MGIARIDHIGVRLLDGRVLAAGGVLGTRQLASAEIYDPVSGTWSRTASMNQPRLRPTQTLLADGRVLVAGGLGSRRTVASAEIYDPAGAIYSTP
jgi:Kelch motif